MSRVGCSDRAEPCTTVVVNFERSDRPMDKKQKKRLEVINKKLQTLRPRLAGVREQMDDADELKQLEDEIASLERESQEIRASK